MLHGRAVYIPYACHDPSSDLWVGMHVVWYCGRADDDEQSLFSGQGASSDSIQVLLVYIVAVAFCGAVLFLLAFHIRLIAKNCTTLEDMGGRRSPYDLGSWKANAVQVFGSRKLLWFLPLPSSVGDGLTFPVLMSDNDDESAPLAESRDDNEPRISV